MSTSANNLAHLDSTLTSLNGGLHEARQGATRSLNSWIDTLKGSADTKLNGVAVEAAVETPLKPGDEITIGAWTRIVIEAR